MVSKLNYWNYEGGEFDKEQNRTYDEVIELIETFDWVGQKTHSRIFIGAPSITIQNLNSEYLKLAPSFNERFALYYLDSHNKLYKKTFNSFRDSYGDIRAFFESGKYDIHDFRPESTLDGPNSRYFVTQNFEYKVTNKVAKRFFKRSCFFSLILFAIILIPMFFMFDPERLGELAFIFLAFSIISGGTIAPILFFNYYLHDKNKTLIMQKSVDTFFFGNKGDLKKFNKNDIAGYMEYQFDTFRSPIPFFTAFEIIFKDGSRICFTNILIDKSLLKDKLYKCKFEHRKTIPFVNK